MADHQNSEQPTKHTPIASWVFGSLLLLFYMGVFTFAPDNLPEFKHKMLAIISALLCALFTFFFVGSLKVTLNIKNKWAKLAIQSGGGAAAFVLILWWWNNPEFAPIKRTQSAEQKTTVLGLNNQVNSQNSQGNQSPNIKNSGGNVNVQYNNYSGVPQTALDRLEELLKEKDIKLQDRDRVIENWIQKYKGLENQLASRTDNIAVKAQTLLVNGQLDQAEALFTQALANDIKNTAADAYSLAGIKALQLNYTDAKKYYQKAAQLEPDNPLYLNDFASQLYILGRYEEAEQLFKQSLEIWEKALSKDDPQVAVVLNNLAELYRMQGKYDQAEQLFKQSLEIWEKALSKDHPHVAQSLNNLAELYQAQGKYDQAEQLFKQSLEIWEKALSKLSKDSKDSKIVLKNVAIVLNNLAELYLVQDKYDQAEQLFKQSLEIWEKALSKDDPQVAAVLNNLAELYRMQGKYDQAEQLFKQSLEIREKALGKNHPDVAQSLNNLALLYQAQGKYDQAEQLFKQSLEILEKDSKDSPNIAIVLKNLVELYRTQGKYAEAEKLLKR